MTAHLILMLHNMQLVMTRFLITPMRPIIARSFLYVVEQGRAPPAERIVRVATYL